MAAAPAAAMAAEGLAAAGTTAAAAGAGAAAGLGAGAATAGGLGAGGLGAMGSMGAMSGLSGLGAMGGLGGAAGGMGAAGGLGAAGAGGLGAAEAGSMAAANAIPGMAAPTATPLSSAAPIVEKSITTPLGGSELAQLQADKAGLLAKKAMDPMQTMQLAGKLMGQDKQGQQRPMMAPPPQMAPRQFQPIGQPLAPYLYQARPLSRG